MPDASSSQPERATHWEGVYRSKADHEISWHQDEPQPSVDLVRRFAKPGGRIVDVGGGSSALAGCLAADGLDVTVLDVSAAAIERASARGSDAQQHQLQRVRWVVADVLETNQLGLYDVWHDRAVFHFLTEATDRQRYAERAQQHVNPGGCMIIGTFAADGPARCSGLPVQRYDAAQLAAAFAPAFTLVESLRTVHRTPWGSEQPFQFVVLRRA